MKSAKRIGKVPGSTGSNLSLPGGIGSGLLILAAMSFLSWWIVGRMGTLGLVVLGVISLAAIVILVFVFKYPAIVVMIWFLTMSGFGTLGMLRMPGIPDFSFPRLLLIILMVMMPLGLILGRSLIKPPYWPDVLLVSHTFYVLINLRMIGDVTHFHTWYNSNLGPLIAYFFAKQYIRKESQIRVIMVSLILVTVYFWWVSIFEKFGIDSLVWPRYITDLSIGKVWSGRSRGPFLQPALFGQILGMYLLVHLFVLTRKISLMWKTLTVANLAFGIIGLFFTYTRGGWLATIVAVGVMALLRPRFRKIVLIAAVIGVLLGAIGLMQVADDEYLEERFSNTNTIENRLGFLAISLRMIQDHPFFGIGYFNYMEVKHLYNQGTYIPFYGYVKKRLGADVPIHDIYLGRAAEEGLISLFLFLSFVIVIAMHYRRRWGENPEGTWFDRDTLAVMAAMSISYLVGGMVIDYRYFDLINIIPFFLAGIVVGYPRHQDSPIPHSSSDKGSLPGPVG
jgi:O-antigen ligase